MFMLEKAYPSSPMHKDGACLRQHVGYPPGTLGKDLFKISLMKMGMSIRKIFYTW